MTSEKTIDAVDAICAQWASERPDLALQNMEIIGRLKRCAALVQPKLADTFAEFGLNIWEFDVLATLRRSGKPYCLAPTELFSTLMITSGTMTHRMAQLEKRGLIERLANPDDARSKLVQLTQEGFELVDRAVTAHVANEERILEGLDHQQKAQLNENLRLLLARLES